MLAFESMAVLWTFECHHVFTLQVKGRERKRNEWQHGDTYTVNIAKVWMEKGEKALSMYQERGKWLAMSCKQAVDIDCGQSAVNSWVTLATLSPVSQQTLAFGSLFSPSPPCHWQLLVTTFVSVKVKAQAKCNHKENTMSRLTDDASSIISLSSTRGTKTQTQTLPVWYSGWIRSHVKAWDTQQTTHNRTGKRENSSIRLVTLMPTSNFLSVIVFMFPE